MNDKTRAVADVLIARLGEQSTWQGIGFVVGLTGAKFGLGMDWGQASGLGGCISAALKVVMPDKKP